MLATTATLVPQNDSDDTASRSSASTPYYGWVIVGVAMLAVFVSSPGQTYVISVFVDPIQRDTGWSRTLISGLYTIGSLTAATGILVVGRLMDRFGSRVALTVAGLFLGLAAVWMSRVNGPFDLYVGFALLRLLGQGSLTVVPTALVALWFVRLRGRALALTSLGAVTGQAVFPPLVHLLIVRTDWRTAWVVLALVVWGLLVPAALIFVRRSPESMGLLPDGDVERSGRAGGAASTLPGRENEWTLADALRTRTFWLLLGAVGSQSLISTALTFHHIAFMDSLGVGAAAAASVFTVIAPASLVGTFLAGVLVDRIAGRYLLALAQACLAVAMLWAVVVAQPRQALVYGGLLGFTSGFVATLQAAIWPNYFGTRHVGTIRSAAATGTIASAAIGPFPFGWMSEITGSYRVTVLAFVILPVVSGLAGLGARPPRK